MLLGALFTLVAVFYASVGFGGGSSYLALLVLWDVPYRLLPIIALVCNITVVSGNAFHYLRAGYMNWRLLLPCAISSVPFAYFGGRVLIEKEIFVAILFVTLLATGLRMLVHYRRYDDPMASYRQLSLWAGGVIGAVLGFLSGIAGIGGGIFLAPVLYHLRAGSPKQIAATASLFILVNSVAGLIGQLQKNAVSQMGAAIYDYWYLPILVLIGGQLGNAMTIKFISPRMVALLTALLVLFVAMRLGIGLFSA
jgi:uncharacterized membrane protein YfcA